MFSDKYRFKKIIVLALAILSLGFYSYQAGPKTEITYQDCLKEPEKYQGQEIVIGYAPIVSQDGESLVLKDCEGSVLIKGVKKKVAAKHVSLKGIFQDGVLVLTQIRTHPWRYLKYSVSLIPVILVTASFFKEFTFNFQELVFKKKKTQLLVTNY